MIGWLIIIGLGIKEQIMKTDLFYHPYLQQVTSENVLATILPLSNDFLQNMFAIIEENLDDQGLTVDFLAKQMAVSNECNCEIIYLQQQVFL